ncbi:putative E3 ubiquitin-protein ligase HECTD2 [Menidia menidia]
MEGEQRLPPIGSQPPVLGRGVKPPFPPLGSFVSTLSQRREAGGRGLSGGPPGATGIRHGRDLPPILSAVRQKRVSVETLPPEAKAPFPRDPVLPQRTKTTRDFQEDVERAVQSGDWREVRDFYLTTFDSFLEINAAFKREANGSFNTTEDSGVNSKFVSAVYDALLSTPQDIQKSVLKGIINSLLREWKGPRTKDDLRAYFILIQNPQYSSTSTYVIYAHLLRQISALSEADHHFLVHWLKRLSARRFRSVVERLLQFISTRLLPPDPEELPPPAKSCWWIPAASRVLSLLNAANSLASPPIMPFTDFYNTTLEHIDFMEEYRTWQSYGNSNRFSFCQFPFILSTVVKKAIIQKDSEQQMISQARVRPKKLQNPHLPAQKRTFINQSINQSIPGLALIPLPLQVVQEELGVVRSYNLKPGGDKIPVSKQNRNEYVQLYVDFLLNKSIYKQFAAFYHGFHSVCASDALMLLRPEEVEMLVCGSPELDMSVLQRAAQYEGYSKTDATVRCFWDVVLSFPLDLQKKLLHFATGSDRVPVGGMADLNFKISKIDVPTDWLPVSHTCFNQIGLPPYRTRRELKLKLTIAISHAQGFGLE